MIGRLIDGRYQVRSRIARGGMATVYLATDLRLERRVAIKVMHGHLADDSTFKSRFVQEARSAARLAHPNVVNVFDQGQDSDMAYLVMEYLPGITLRDLLKDYGKLTPEQTIDIMEAVLSGLAAAHIALLYPSRFPAALCQSGSFWFEPDAFAQLARQRPPVKTRFWLSVGDEETDEDVSHPPTGLFQGISQIAGVERARAVLEENGGEVNCHRYRGGHSFEHWRAELSDAVQWLLRTAQ